MRIKEGFVLRDVCGETVIVGEGLEAVNFGKLIVLNETAAWLWKEAKGMGNFSLDSLTERLCEEFDVSHDVAATDISTIVNKWRDLNVIEEQC